MRTKRKINISNLFFVPIVVITNCATVYSLEMQKSTKHIIGHDCIANILQFPLYGTIRKFSDALKKRDESIKNVRCSNKAVYINCIIDGGEFIQQ